MKKSRAIFASWLVLTVVGCSGEDPAAPGAANPGLEDGGTGTGGSGADGVTPPPWDADPDAFVQDGEASVACVPPQQLLQPTPVVDPIALIVTSTELQPAFQRLAAFHKATGVPTEVVTVEAICGGSCSHNVTTNDEAKAIKTYLRNLPSVAYVILGGDIDAVPSRTVRDSYQNPFLQSYTYHEFFTTDYYYSDLSVWDTNGDGTYAQDGVDTPDYRPELAVARIPVSTVAEADRYLEKVIQHCTAYNPDDVTRSLFLSNVAAEFLGIDIDGAHYMEAAGRTLGLVPHGFDVKKLYATASVDPSAEIINVDNQVREIQSGKNLVVHSGHSAANSLTIELDGSKDFTGQMAYDLQNTTYPIYLSCGCEAGVFVGGDGAGEKLINAPSGGAVAYVGNAVIGLGLAGGMQLIDLMLGYIQNTQDPGLGDAYLFAHALLPEHDVFQVPILPFPVPVVDKDSYEWTQKAVVLFGDPLLPVWTVVKEPPPQLTASSEPLCDGVRVTFQLSPPATGTLRILADDTLYSVEVAGDSHTVELPGPPQALEVGWTSPGAMMGYYHVDL